MKLHKNCVIFTPALLWCEEDDDADEDGDGDNGTWIILVDKQHKMVGNSLDDGFKKKITSTVIIIINAK